MATDDSFFSLYERLLKENPMIGANGYPDRADPPPADRPSLRDFCFALSFLWYRSGTDNVYADTVAKRASHALFDELLGDQIGSGAVCLAATALGYEVFPPQEGGPGLLQWTKDAHAKH